MLESLSNFLEGNIPSEQKAKANGILKLLKKGDTLLLLTIACEIFNTLETGVKKLAGCETTIGGVLEAAELMKEQLQEGRDQFDDLYKNVIKRPWNWTWNNRECPVDSNHQNGLLAQEQLSKRTRLFSIGG